MTSLDNSSTKLLITQYVNTRVIKLEIVNELSAIHLYDGFKHFLLTEYHQIINIDFNDFINFLSTELYRFAYNYSGHEVVRPFNAKYPNLRLTLVEDALEIDTSSYYDRHPFYFRT